MYEENAHPIRLLLCEDIYQAVCDGRLPKVIYDVSVAEEDLPGEKISWSHIQIKCVLPPEYLDIRRQASLRNVLFSISQAYTPRSIDNSIKPGLLVEIVTLDSQGKDMLQTIIDASCGKNC